MKINSQQNILNLIMILVLALIWGSSFILMKRGLDVYTSEQVAALRILIAFLFLSPLLIKYFKKEWLKHWKAFIIVGFIGSFIPAFLFTKAETGINSSLAGMLNSLTPLFTLILGVLFFKTSTKWFNVLGVIMGLTGAMGLLSVGAAGDLDRKLIFVLYVITATLCYALSVNINKKFLNQVDPVAITIWSFLFIGPLAGIYLFTTDFTLRLTTSISGFSSLGYISILAIFGTAVSIIIFNYLISRTNALFASSVTYLIPVVAIFWGVIDGEVIEIEHFIWMLLIITGVYLVNKKVKAPEPLI